MGVLDGVIEGNTNKPIVYRVKWFHLFLFSFETEDAFNSFSNLSTLIMNHGQFVYYNPDWAEDVGVHVLNTNEMEQIEDVANILFDIRDVPLGECFTRTRLLQQINSWHKENGRLVYHGKQSKDE